MPFCFLVFAFLCFLLHRHWYHADPVTTSNLSSPAWFRRSWDNLLTLFWWKYLWKLVLLFNCSALIWKLGKLQILFCHYHFPNPHVHSGAQDEGAEVHRKYILVVKREMQEDKLETGRHLNLCLQHTFISIPLAKNSHEMKHNNNMQENILCF